MCTGASGATLGEPENVCLRPHFGKKQQRIQSTTITLAITHKDLLNEIGGHCFLEVF
jgi:hypothetical protein